MPPMSRLGTCQARHPALLLLVVVLLLLLLVVVVVLLLLLLSPLGRHQVNYQNNLALLMSAALWMQQLQETLSRRGWRLPLRLPLRLPRRRRYPPQRPWHQP